MRSKLLIVAGLATSMLLVTATSASAQRGVRGNHHNHNRHHVQNGPVVIVDSAGNWARADRRANVRADARDRRQLRRERKRQRRMMRRAVWNKNQTIARVNAKCARVDARFWRGKARRICKRTIRRAIANHNATWGTWAPLQRWEFAGLPSRSWRAAPGHRTHVLPSRQVRNPRRAPVVVQTF